MKCLLDLDGVLADFHKQWHIWNDVPYPDPWPAGVWSLAEVHGMSWEATCARLNLKFWLQMPWMEDGREILTLLESHFGPENICLVTSNHVADAPTAAYGKVQWIEHHLRAYAHRYFIGAAKHFLSHKGAILVDDKNENCDSFEEEGGAAFLLPRPWNRRHGAGKAVDRLKEYLDGCSFGSSRS